MKEIVTANPTESNVTYLITDVLPACIYSRGLLKLQSLLPNKENL